jgi:hypothetical protein
MQHNVTSENKYAKNSSTTMWFVSEEDLQMQISCKIKDTDNPGHICLSLQMLIFSPILFHFFFQEKILWC